MSVWVYEIMGRPIYSFSRLPILMFSLDHMGNLIENELPSAG